MLPSPCRVPAMPRLPSAAHKGTRGTVVVIGGAATMLGAPCFTAHAALRCGAGVVLLAVPAAIRTTCLGLVPSAMAMVPDDHGRFLAELPEHAVVAMGMGMTPSAGAARLLGRVIARGQRLVIDGGGFACLRQLRGPRFAGGQVILTPHPGEWGVLAEIYGIQGDPIGRGRPAAARALALATNACVVLKGRHTVISDARHGCLNLTGNHSLAIPGSGDTLSGIIAALLARGMELMPAARLAAHVHGRCGERWSARHGLDGLSAWELADQLPEVLTRLGRASAHRR